MPRFDWSMDRAIRIEQRLREGRRLTAADLILMRQSSTGG
jgi:hypothetical protein